MVRPGDLAVSCRLFVEPGRLREGYVNVTDSDYHYLFRVRRLKVGGKVELFDGDGRTAAATVHKIEKRRGTLIAEAPVKVPRALGARIELVVSLVKGERLGWVAAKLVEIGVDRIVPVWGDRTVQRPKGGDADKILARLNLVVREAARQCRTAYVPEVAAPQPLADALARAAPDATKVLLFEGDTTVKLRDAIAADSDHVIAAIGPEGGFAPTEVEAATAAGFRAVSLGPRILRAETAAVTAASVIRFIVGDLG